MVLFGGEGKRKEAAAQAASSAGRASGEIAYDAGLIGKLEAEHRELMSILTAIKNASRDGHYNQLPELLANFKHAFLNHVGLENVKLYVYIQQNSALDADTLNFVSSVRKEMNEIARAVMKFIDTHIAAAPTPAAVTGFHAQLDQAEAALIKRVQIEEGRLYALYQAG